MRTTSRHGALAESQGVSRSAAGICGRSSFYGLCLPTPSARRRRSTGERRVWARALSNVKIKLLNAAPHPAPEDLAAYRDQRAPATRSSATSLNAGERGYRVVLLLPKSVLRRLQSQDSSSPRSPLQLEHRGRREKQWVKRFVMQEQWLRPFREHNHYGIHCLVLQHSFRHVLPPAFT